MWTIIAGPGNQTTECMCVLVKKDAGSQAGRLFGRLPHVLLFFLYRFLKVVGAYAGNFAISLVEFDEIQIGAFSEGAVDLYLLPLLSQFVDIPRFLLSVDMWGGYAFGHFQLVIHVESPFGHIPAILLTFLLSFPLPFVPLESSFDFHSGGAVFADVPGYVLMGGVSKHGGGVDGVERSFWVEHGNKIMTDGLKGVLEMHVTIQSFLTTPARSF